MKLALLMLSLSRALVCTRRFAFSIKPVVALFLSYAVASLRRMPCWVKKESKSPRNSVPLSDLKRSWLARFLAGLLEAGMPASCRKVRNPTSADALLWLLWTVMYGPGLGGGWVQERAVVPPTDGILVATC